MLTCFYGKNSRNVFPRFVIHCLTIVLVMSASQGPMKRGRQSSFLGGSSPSTAFSTPKSLSKPIQPLPLEKQHVSGLFDTSQGTIQTSPARTTRIGVVVSLTSSYYLVQSEKEWLPIRFSELIGEDGEVVARSTPFTVLKHKKVQLKRTGVTYKAYLIGEKEETEGEEEPENKGETVYLARKLCEEVTAMVLVAKASNNRSSSVPVILSSARSRLHSALPDLIATPSLSQALANKLRLHLANLSSPFPLCPYCHHPQSHLLSCGHYYCRPCLRKAPAVCSQCHQPLSKADIKLAACWKP